MSVRYVVRPCDNLGSVKGLKRDRTWVVVRKHDGQEQVVADLFTRKAAYEYKRQCEREEVQP